MIISKARSDEIDDIMEVYRYAREFMAANGNPNQWGDGYPETSLIKEDIEKGNFYVMKEDGKIVGVFAFIIGEDETYSYIEDGKWSYDETYGTIHRVAGNGTVKGVFKECLDYCSCLCSYIRIDTHPNNIPMQRAILKNGFRECGIIYVRDGSKRIAYDRKKIE